MTAVHAAPPVPVAASWREPRGIAPRGTVIVVPGRGEHPSVYERFGRRIAADGYRVEAVSAPTVDEARTERQIRTLLASVPSASEGATGPEPRVLVGSDTGALFAAGLVADGVAGVAGLVLAGLPTAGRGRVLSWEDELAARTACPTHRNLLDGDPALRRGAFAPRLPEYWFTRARPEAISVPVLGVHGAADPFSPLDDGRRSPLVCRGPLGRARRDLRGQARRAERPDPSHRGRERRPVPGTAAPRRGSPRAGPARGAAMSERASEPRRYVVIGAGAVGATLAAELHLAGIATVLVARGAHLAALRTAGLRYLRPDG
ncbi:MAG: thiosulfate/3-mercaptopyruvate sulfurtransferase, partial [Pseudonocardiales bacterium]|nr:thiosulfate/3-mercaptopyruvate sulfurtransferase [Pseudonocardiales bacterium]